MILMTVKDNDCDGRNDIKDIRVEGATDDELLYSIGVLTFIAKDLGHPFVAGQLAQAEDALKSFIINGYPAEGLS